MIIIKEKHKFNKEFKLMENKHRQMSKKVNKSISSGVNKLFSDKEEFDRRWNSIRKTKQSE